MPDSEEAQMMTVTSGRSCSDALTKSSPIGSFVRTLVGSSRWWSKVAFLKWQVKPIYSERRIQFTDTNTEQPLPWNESAKTSDPTDMKSSLFLFRLAVSVPHTEETESSSSQGVLLQTPTAVQTEEAPERMRARAEKNGYRNGTKFGSLTSQIKYDPRVRYMLLPTPTAGEAEKYRLQYTPGSQMGTCLSAMAASGMLPTPSARDWKGKTNPGVVKPGSGCIYGETLPDAIDRMVKELVEESGSTIPEGDGCRLSPLFTEEVMGFPFLWTTLPFLKASGEMNQSKPSEMPSSPK